MGTRIEWAEETWNPIVGCSKCSPGCDHCYAERMANRLAHIALKKRPGLTMGNARNRLEGYVKVVDRMGCWNGEVFFNPEDDKPLHIKKPSRIFVCSMGDLFHEKIHESWIMSVLAIQEDAPQHTYIWLTKRPERMREVILKLDLPVLENIWLGVTVCNQKEAEEKIPILFQTPAAVRFVSIEPMLGPVDFGSDQLTKHWGPGLDWVIVGGESGPGARPMHPDWVRSARDQCAAAGVPFLFKQWGGCNKKKAGRMLDGKVHDEYPRVLS
jgi:protein gp37